MPAISSYRLPSSFTGSPNECGTMHLLLSRPGSGFATEPSGLVTLCTECHAALTAIRTQRAVLRNPRLQQLGRGAKQELFNVFQLWALSGEKLPFRVKKAS